MNWDTLKDLTPEEKEVWEDSVFAAKLRGMLVEFIKSPEESAEAFVEVIGMFKKHWAEGGKKMWAQCTMYHPEEATEEEQRHLRGKMAQHLSLDLIREGAIEFETISKDRTGTGDMGLAGKMCVVLPDEFEHDESVCAAYCGRGCEQWRERNSKKK